MWPSPAVTIEAQPIDTYVFCKMTVICDSLSEFTVNSQEKIMRD